MATENYERVQVYLSPEEIEYLDRLLHSHPWSFGLRVVRYNSRSGLIRALVDKFKKDNPLQAK